MLRFIEGQSWRAACSRHVRIAGLPRDLPVGEEVIVIETKNEGRYAVAVRWADLLSYYAGYARAFRLKSPHGWRLV